MKVIDAGYLDERGEYIEELMYFSFEPSEEEKRKILEEDFMRQLYEYQELNQSAA